MGQLKRSDHGNYLHSNNERKDDDKSLNGSYSKYKWHAIAENDSMRKSSITITLKTILLTFIRACRAKTCTQYKIQKVWLISI